MTLTALRSMGIGVGGSLILALFCTTFMPLGKVLYLLPVLVGVNSLVSGYRMVDLLKGRITRVRLFPAVMGLGEGALVFLAVNLAGVKSGMPFLLGGADLVALLIVSGITSYLGACLAAGYFKL